MPSSHEQQPLALFLPEALSDKARPTAEFSIEAASLSHALIEVNDQLTEHPQACIEVQESGSGRRLLVMDSRQALKNRLHPHARLYGASTTDARLKQFCPADKQAFGLVWQLCHSLAARDLPPEGVMSQDAEPKNTEPGNTETQGAVPDGFKQPDFSGHYWSYEPGKRREVQLVLDGTESGEPVVLQLAQGSALLAPLPLAEYWLTFCASSAQELALALESAITGQPLTQNTNLTTSQLKSHRQAQGSSDLKPYRAVVMAHSSIQLSAELKALHNHLQTRSTLWLQTPTGSCYCPPNHSVNVGELAFIYPGVGTVWGGMYQGLHLYFPTLFETCQHLPLKEMLQMDALQQADRHAPLSLAQQAVAGVGLSWLLTQILIREFNLTPDMALGYSMGEISMWAAMGIWDKPEALIEPTLNAPLFNQELSGPLNAVRQLWHQQQADNASVQGETAPQSSQPNWGCFMLRADSEQVQLQIEALFGPNARLYMPIRHYDSCIVAGDKAQAEILINVLGCTALTSSLVTAMHTPATWHLHDELRAFYQHETSQEAMTDCVFFSASQSLPMSRNTPELSSKLASSIADTLCEPLSFPALVSKVTTQGARVFVEVGADRQLTSLLSKQKLSWHPMKSLACNSKGAPPHISLLKCISALWALGLELNRPLSARSNTDYLNQQDADGNGQTATTQAPQESPHVISR